MNKWICTVCGFIYDEDKGLPEEGIAPGTRWNDIPDDWRCPECSVGKEDFEMVLMEEGQPRGTEFNRLLNSYIIDCFDYWLIWSTIL